MTEKKIKIEFAPGAFDTFDGTQEELDALITELERMAESGELEANSIALDGDDIWDELSEEDFEQVQQAIQCVTGKKPLH